MGLDMYLKAEKYVGGWNFSGENDKAAFKQITKAVGTEKLVTPDSPSLVVRTNVAYWRKANSIHSWFVRKLAKGVDECQAIHVPAKSLKELIAECQAALVLYEAGEVEKAGHLMQPVSGFFFGDTEIDDLWADDLRDTIKQLTPLLEFVDCFEFYYQASW